MNLNRYLDVKPEDPAMSATLLKSRIANASRQAEIIMTER